MYDYSDRDAGRLEQTTREEISIICTIQIVAKAYAYMMIYDIVQGKFNSDKYMQLSKHFKRRNPI